MSDKGEEKDEAERERLRDKAAPGSSREQAGKVEGDGKDGGKSDGRS